MQRNNEGKTPICVDDDDPEHVTNKKVKGTGSGEATKGNRVTHRDKVERTLNEPTMVSCTLCSFVITCWTIELARNVVRNHQCRRHPRKPDKHMVPGTYNVLEETGEKILAIDNEEPNDDEKQKSVQEINSK